MIIQAQLDKKTTRNRAAASIRWSLNRLLVQEKNPFRAKLAQRVHMMSDDAAETTSDADWEQLRPLIDGFMMKLQERDRMAILLRFFANRSFRDIGEQLGLNEKVGAKPRMQSIRHS